MKNKAIIICVAVVAAFALAAVSGCKGPKVEKPAAAKESAKSAVQAPMEAKQMPAKAFTKDMGGLTVKISDTKGAPKAQRVKVFKVTDKNSSVYFSGQVSNRMQELPPGTYDIEVDTMPPTIYKNIAVAKDKETVQDIGCPTGSLMIKAMTSGNKEARYAARLFYPNTTTVVAFGIVNRPIEVLSGTYDVEIVTAPPQSRKGVKIESGKEALVDMGMTTGSLNVKAVDDKGNALKLQTRIKSADTGKFVSAGTTGRSAELVAGMYDVDILSKPPQSKKGVAIKAGEELVIDIIAEAPVKKAPQAARPKAVTKPAAKPIAAPAKPAALTQPAAPAPAAVPAEKKQ